MFGNKLLNRILNGKSDWLTQEVVFHSCWLPPFSKNKNSFSEDKEWRNGGIKYTLGSLSPLLQGNQKYACDYEKRPHPLQPT